MERDEPEPQELIPTKKRIFNLVKRHYIEALSVFLVSVGIFLKISEFDFFYRNHKADLGVAVTLMLFLYPIYSCYYLFYEYKLKKSKTVPFFDVLFQMSFLGTLMSGMVLFFVYFYEGVNLGDISMRNVLLSALERPLTGLSLMVYNSEVVAMYLGIADGLCLMSSYVYYKVTLEWNVIFGFTLLIIGLVVYFLGVCKKNRDKEFDSNREREYFVWKGMKYFVVLGFIFLILSFFVYFMYFRSGTEFVKQNRGIAQNKDISTEFLSKHSIDRDYGKAIRKRLSNEFRNLKKKENLVTFQIGDVVFDIDDLRKRLGEFITTIWNVRPIRNNQYGIQINKMFALWFILRKFKPDVVVELGVNRGQTTWVIRKTLPNSRIVSFDPVDPRKYRENFYDNNPRTKYIVGKNFVDFRDVQIESMGFRLDDNVLCYVDDHQSHSKRLFEGLLKFNITDFVLDDNYFDIGRGDHLTVQQMFSTQFSREEYPFEIYLKYKDNCHEREDMISFEHHFAINFFWRSLVRNYAVFPPISKDDTINFLGLKKGERIPPSLFGNLAELVDAHPKVKFSGVQKERGEYSWTCFLRILNVK